MHITPSLCFGKIKAPPSKSQTLRALYFSLLAKGTSTIFSPLKAQDSEAMQKAICLFGATIEEGEDVIKVTSQGGIPQKKGHCLLDAGNSGIVYRFMAALGALVSCQVSITGDHSILNTRPILPLTKALNSLGAYTLKQEGAPLIIQGPMKAGNVTIDGRDSQPVSALLYALSFAQGQSTITVENMAEKPWIDLSLSWLDRFQIPYHRHDDHFTLQGKAHIESFQYKVPGDFSSISNFLALGAIQNQSILLENLNFADAQGDKVLIDLLKQMGARIEIKGDTLIHLPHRGLIGIDIDMDLCIDLLPILAVVACFAKGKTMLYHIEAAKLKECNRVFAIMEELKKMGGHLSLEKDALIITPSSLHGALLSTYQDHRMAMALCVAALCSSTPSMLENPKVVGKTYPSFFKEIINIGGKLEPHLSGL